MYDEIGKKREIVFELVSIYDKGRLSIKQPSLPRRTGSLAKNSQRNPKYKVFELTARTVPSDQHTQKELVKMIIPISVNKFVRQKHRNNLSITFSSSWR